MKFLPNKLRVCQPIMALLMLITLGCGMVRSLGKNPEGNALLELQQLSIYKNGGFQNTDREDSSKVNRGNALKAMFSRPESVTPQAPLPWVNTDVKALNVGAPTLIWFGHSSVLIKTQTRNILIDPIFSNHAGPIPGMIKAFKGSKHYSADDMPVIDVLIISHDHYDHLDYRTIKKLRNRIKKVVVPKGVGSHFLYWGFKPENITELNWNESYTLPDGIKVTATPARHRSNRTFAANKTLWASYVIQTGAYRLFYSGDGGYGNHFKQIGKQYGPFNLALMECGQYSVNWPSHHMHPTQSAQAAHDLQAQMIEPVHWAKFAESTHPWNEPVSLLIPAAESLGITVNTPRIGEPYTVGTPAKTTVWWAFE
jgi:L-ascorbate metabolism protein UlaG (beta-lactamase superfamily)